MIDGPIQSAAGDYCGLVETMQFAQQMRPLYASDEEYQAALDTLMTSQLGADWRQQVQHQEEQLAAHGSQLLTQMAQLMDLPGNHPMRPELDRFIEETLADPAAQAAISFALRMDPGLAQGATGERLLALFATPGLGENERALAVEFGNAYIAATTSQALALINSNDPASITEAQAQIGALDDPQLAAVLGVPTGSLTSAVGALQAALPGLTSGDEADVTAAATSLGNSLNGIPGFSEDDAAGQVFRGMAVSASGSAYINANDLQLDDPRVESLLDQVIGNLDFLKGTSFTAKALLGAAINGGLVNSTGFIRGFGLGNTLTGRLLGVVGIATNSWNAFKAFGEGDVGNGLLHTGVAGGTLAGLLGAGTVIGPIGWAIAAVSFIGLGLSADAEHRNRFETEQMRDFLAASGLSDVAAAELYNTTGGSVSPIPFLLHYADQQGLSVEQTIQWLNGLAANDQLSDTVALAHRTIDESGGDGTGLPATNDGDAELQVQLNGDARWQILISHAPTSLTQFDLMLETAGIPTPG